MAVTVDQIITFLSEPAKDDHKKLEAQFNLSAKVVSVGKDSKKNQITVSISDNAALYSNCMIATKKSINRRFPNGSPFYLNPVKMMLERGKYSAWLGNKRSVEEAMVEYITKTIAIVTAQKTSVIKVLAEESDIPLQDYFVPETPESDKANEKEDKEKSSIKGESLNVLLRRLKPLYFANTATNGTGTSPVKATQTGAATATGFSTTNTGTTSAGSSAVLSTLAKAKAAKALADAKANAAANAKSVADSKSSHEAQLARSSSVGAAAVIVATSSATTAIAAQPAMLYQYPTASATNQASSMAALSQSSPTIAIVANGSVNKPVKA